MLRGIGSNPHFPPGLHFESLLIPSQVPLNGPNSLIACSIYVEHVGTNPHVDGKIGLIQNL